MMARRETPDVLVGLEDGGADDVRAAMGPQAQRVATVYIRLDGGTQPRAGIDQAVVEDYHQDMANGAVFPPVELVYDGTDYWLWDGFHRFQAWRKDGDRLITANVRQGTRRDAVLLSVGANAKHGFRRSSEDKRRAIETLLRDEEWSKWSDREIARQVAVDHKTVSARRAALSGEIPQIETRRVERNGKEYTMATPQRGAAPAVASQAANYATPEELDAAVRAWLGCYDTRDEREAALVEVIELGENSVTFDDLVEWIDVKARRSADLIHAAGRVLVEIRRGVVNERAAVRGLDTPQTATRPAEAIRPEEQPAVLSAQRPRPSAGELASALKSRLQLLWARAHGGDTALRALLDELEQPGFPYTGSTEMWRNFETWYKQTYAGEWQPSMWDVREVLRTIAPAAEPAAELTVTTEPGPARGREMEFEKRLINQGKTVKLFGRNQDGTLTVTINVETVHIYSPGMTLTQGDARQLVDRMSDAMLSQGGAE